MKNEWHFLAKIFSEINEGDVIFTILRDGNLFGNGQEFIDSNEQKYIMGEDKNKVYEEFFKKLKLTLSVDNNLSDRTITISKNKT